MTEPYCGKTCDDCGWRERLDCPGCRVGPGSTLFCACSVAACCHSKGHESCGTCSFRTGCSLLHRRSQEPEARLKRGEDEKARRAAAARRAAFLGRWLWLLFWLILPAELAELLTLETVALWSPALAWFGQVLGVLCSAAYGLILLKVSSEEPCCYRTAGICSLVVSAIQAVLLCIPGGNSAGWSLLFTLPAAVLALVSFYYECMAHAEVLLEADHALSEKWRLLWRWYAAATAALFGGTFLLLIIPLLGVLLLLAGSVGLLVLSILKLVYLYRTARLFRSCPPADVGRASL